MSEDIVACKERGGWTVRFLISQMPLGPDALKALGLPPGPATRLSKAAAERLAEAAHAAMEQQRPERKSAKRLMKAARK